MTLGIRAALSLLAATAVIAVGAPAASAAPVNDNFANASFLNGEQTTAVFDLSTATKQPGEPNHEGDSMGRSVWYRWTPAKTGAAHVTLCGGSPYPGYAKRIAVYTGGWGSLSKVSPVGIEACAPPVEKRWIAKAGTTYWIAVDVYQNEDPDLIGKGELTLEQDTQPPVTSFKNWPATTGKRPTVQMITTGGDDLTSWECFLDGKPFPNCEPGAQLPDPFVGSLAGGTHTFKVRATDFPGNVEATWKTRTWQVDTTPPKTTITSENHRRVTSPPTHTWAATEPGQTFECHWSGTGPEPSSWFPCTSPLTAPKRPLGIHHLTVRGVDPYGNEASVYIYWEIVAPSTPKPPDLDYDGIADATDNCLGRWNRGQQDSDADGKGDACDPPVPADRDGDGAWDGSDNCPGVANPGQQDTDLDRMGDACDPRVAATPALIDLRAKRARKGATALLTVTEPAKVTVRLQRCSKLRGGRCRAWRSRASRTLLAFAGTTTVRLSPTRKLRRGRYRISAQLSGGSSEAMTVHFRVR